MNDGLPPLREVIRALGLTARKSLGQHFLLDLNLTSRIARAAGPLADSTILEIGPGPGGLTRALLAEGAGQVIAVEKDARCGPALAAIAERYPGRLTVIFGDALDAMPDLAQIASPIRVVANLPYGVATPLLVGWLKTEPWPPRFDRMVLMFQREVADRIVASPGGKAYGRLSVLTQWRCEARVLFNVPARAFTPVPNVDSAIVAFTPLPSPIACAAGALERVTAAAFGQRRKMLRASLKTLTGEPELLLGAAGIDPTRRAETLSVAEFCDLARLVEARGELRLKPPHEIR